MTLQATVGIDLGEKYQESPPLGRANFKKATTGPCGRPISNECTSISALTTGAQGARHPYTTIQARDVYCSPRPNLLIADHAFFCAFFSSFFLPLKFPKHPVETL